jgi:pimeloyl-ACP methyl ester carboxylesterase
VGRQANLLQQLSMIPVPMLWVAGERDEKFKKILAVAGESLGQWAPAQMEIISEAGHRVPWEQPERFHERVVAFLRTLEIAK